MANENREQLIADPSRNGKFVLTQRYQGEELTEIDVPAVSKGGDLRIMYEEIESLFKSGAAIAAFRILGRSASCHVWLNENVIPNPKVQVTSIPHGFNQVPWYYLETWELTGKSRFDSYSIVSARMQVNANSKISGRTKDKKIYEAKVEFMPSQFYFESAFDFPSGG